MSASKAVKASGLKSVAQVSRLTGKHQDTIHNWFRDEPELFNIVVRGCVSLLEEKKIRAS